MPTLSFQKLLPDLAFAKPKALRLGAATYETPVWAKVLEDAARAMLDGARTRKAALAAAKRFPWMGNSGRGMARPRELEPGVWIELHQGSHGILVRTKMLLDACGYPLARAMVEYDVVASAETKTKRINHATRCQKQPKSSNNPPSPRKGEKAGAFARRMFGIAFNNDKVPRSDFFACLDDKEGTKRVFGLLLGGQPLFSRSILKVGHNLRSWTEPFPTRFGFSVFVNSQWRSEHLAKLAQLLNRWNITDSPSTLGYESPVQRTLFEEMKPKQTTLFPEPILTDVHQAKDLSEKIGAYAKRMLYNALAEGRVPEDDFHQLKSHEGTVALLGISLSRCPLFSTKPIITDSGIHSWADPARRNGRPVFVCEEWYARHRPKLDKLLARWKSKSEPDEQQSGEKIGTFAKREIFKALSEGRVPDTDFEILSTSTGTRSLLGLPLKGCPLFSVRPFRKGTQLRTWTEPAVRNGKAVFVSKEWFDRPDEWRKLKKLLARWNETPMSGKKDLPTQIEEFYDGVFSSTDFWEYAAEIYGLDTSPAAKAAQIRCLVQRFIRLDREHWISVPDFRRLSDWDVAKESAFADALNSILGDASFFPFALMQDTILSSFPSVLLDGKRLPWTRELAASVAALLVPAVHVANHGVVPQTLTALLVPKPVSDDAVLDMALAVYCDRFPEKQSVKGAFAFLRENFVRSRLTNNLETEIRKVLAFQAGKAPHDSIESAVRDQKPEFVSDNSDENEKLLDDWADGAF